VSDRRGMVMLMAIFRILQSFGSQINSLCIDEAADSVDDSFWVGKIVIL
jgi:hypothetical protein